MSRAAQNLAFERLVQPHLDRLYRLAWRLAGTKAEAEDLFQELLLKAYGKIDELARIEQPGPWLCRVMYNLFIDRQRHFTRRRLQTVEEAELGKDGMASLAASGAAAAEPEASQRQLERVERLESALAKLSNEHRVVVLLHDAEGYKLKEIQELTDIPVGTIKSRLHRARARLREILTEDGTIS